MTFTFDLSELPLPSKKNSYEIRFNASFWKAIYPIAGKFRQYKQRPYWIGPSRAVKDAEKLIAYVAKVKIKQHLTGPLRLTIDYEGKLDRDNLLGVICDGIEKSGRIVNDRQFKEIVIRRRARKGCSVRIEPIPEHGEDRREM